MHLSPVLAKEIKTYIKNLLDREVTIIDTYGQSVSVNEDDHSVSLSLPKDALAQGDSQELTIDGNTQLVIPLRHQAEVVGALVLRGDMKGMHSYVPLIKSFAELLVQQYLVINKPTLDSTDQFLTKLINNATPAELPLYESEAKVLGYNLTGKRMAMVVHLKDFWIKCLGSFDQASFERDEVIKHWKRNIEQNLASFFTQSTDNIIGYIGNDKFVVLKSVPEGTQDSIISLIKKSHRSIFEPLKNFDVTDLTVGVSNSHEGIQGLLDAYREADLALEFGTRLWGENKSYYFGDLGILSILGEGNREKEIEFAHQLLRKLTNQDLIQTLECFFEENLNLTETAARMGIHRNTVIYRLNQIAQILGIDPRVFEQAITIKIALLIRKLFG